MKIHSILLIFIFLYSCNGGKKTGEDIQKIPYAKENPKYAHGLVIKGEEDYRFVTVRNPNDTNKIYAEYLFVSPNTKISTPEGFQRIEVPVKTFASVSTTHLALLTALGEEERLIGFSGFKYISDPKILKLIDEGKVSEFGADDKFDNEKIIDLSPDALMVYPFEGADFSLMEEAGIPIIYNAEYLENTPLGKAEWIKLAGLLFQKSEQAEKIFNKIEAEYNQTKIASAQTKKPTVILGKPLKNEWFLPCGESYAALFIKDGGGDYLYATLPGNNIQTKSFEEVLDKAIDADYWIFSDASDAEITRESLLKENPLYANFKAFKNGNIIVCNSQKTDYFGQGVLEPDVILKDLVYYLYPGKINHQPKYFKRIP